MFHSFSRRMLNALIIGCLLIITWVQLGFNDNEDTPLERLSTAPLSDTGWHYWHSNENVPVVWQTLGADQLRVVVLRANDKPLHVSLPLSDWASVLSNALPQTTISSVQGVVALQGAADKTTMQQAAAYIIRQLQLTPPNYQISECQLEHLAGAYWWNQQAGQSLAQPAEHFVINPTGQRVLTQSLQNPALPTRDEWQSFRVRSVRELRQTWLSSSAAIDIQAELAYHRWPETYFYDLYQDLTKARRTAPAAFAECLTR